MSEEQLRMIGSQAAAIAMDALDSEDFMARQLADDTLALIAEVRSLRAKLDAVPVDALLFWLDPFASGDLTADAIADAGAKIDAWAQSVRPAVTA